MRLRERGLETLNREFPEVGWDVCLHQLRDGPGVVFDNYRPCWRADSLGAGKEVSHRERYRFAYKALQLLLARRNHDERTLGDLIHCLDAMDRGSQAQVLRLIDEWTAQTNDAMAKARLREVTRRCFFAPNSSGRELDAAITSQARRLHERLSPRDSVARSLWLFASLWVSVDGTNRADGSINDDDRASRLDPLRTEAIREIWLERGFEGIQHLLSIGGIPYLVGQSLSHCLQGGSLIGFIEDSLARENRFRGEESECLRELLRSLLPTARRSVLLAFTDGASTERIVRILAMAPFKQETWDFVSRQGQEVQSGYWQEVEPHWERRSPEELNSLSDALLRAGRPFLAFALVKNSLSQIGTQQLKRLLPAMATTRTTETRSLCEDQAYIAEAIRELDRRPETSSDEMAQIEFLYIGALVQFDYGTPNLARKVCNSPGTFSWAVKTAFKRTDGGEDPPEPILQDSETRHAVARSAYCLLDSLDRIPGTRDDGSIDFDRLRSWVDRVRRACEANGRKAIGDERIGQLLSRESGTWQGDAPSDSVCRVLESIRSDEMGQGFACGLFNTPNKQLRRQHRGGRQERDIAARYRNYEAKLCFDYPFVASLFEKGAKEYEHLASWWDSEDNMTDRLGP